MVIKAAHDSDVGSAGQESIPIHQINHGLTRKVLFKTDLRYDDMAPLALLAATSFYIADAMFSVLPLVALLFLCSFLDRTNVGNAKIIGLEKDIHISPSQYRNGLAIYYACYIARSVTYSHASQPIH